MGCLYRRGRIYWIKYYRNGKPIFESTESEKKEVATRLLKRREGEISKGERPGIYYDRVSFGELAMDYLRDYRVNGKKSLSDAIRNVKVLSDFFGAEVKEIPEEKRIEVFGGMKVPLITTDKAKEFIEQRRMDGLSNASINRELAALKRMFNLAATESTPAKVGQVPYIPMLGENNIRKGFFEFDEFNALREALPDYLKLVVTFGYRIGWRKEEVVSLTWPNLDLKQNVMRLDPGETKNKEGRAIYLDSELSALLHELFAKRRLGCPYIFHRDGKKIGDFRKAWESAFVRSGLGAPYKCKKCGHAFTVFKEIPEKEFACPNCKSKDAKWAGKLFHDFRRTAVRNMVRSGIPETVAMKISVIRPEASSTVTTSRARKT